MKQKEIIGVASQRNVPKTTIDKDWVLGHFLNAIYSFSDIRKTFIFKGGTCLHKCYVDGYRFSEDLDFTLLNKDFVVDKSFIRKIIEVAHERSSARFYLDKFEPQKYNDIPQGYSLDIKFWGADHSPNQQLLPPNRWQTSIHLDISFSEQLVLPPVEKKIMHPYSDKELVTNTAVCYNFKELLSEKVRALKQRNRPRDVYDVWYLGKMIKDEDLHDIRILLFKKSLHKGFAISGAGDFVNNEKHLRNKKAWERSLSHQLSVDVLPEFDLIYNELHIFINKLLA